MTNPSNKPDGATRLSYPSIVSSYQLLEYCTQKYPKRRVVPDRWCPNDQFCYWTRKSEMRVIKNRNEVWVLDARYPWMRRVR